MKKFNFEELFVLAGGLQSHNEPPSPPSDPPPADPPPTPPTPPAPPADPPKTFTQEDVNNLMAKSSKTTTEKMLKDLGIEDFKTAKEGLTKLKEWQDSQKTDNQKLTDDFEALKTSSTENNKLLAGYKARDIAFEKGVLDPKNQAKLVKLASISDVEDMGEAMDALLLEYPMFKGEEKPGQFGASSSGKGASGAVDEKRAAVRKAAGLK